MGKLYQMTYDELRGSDWPAYDDYLNDVFGDDSIKAEILECEVSAYQPTDSLKLKYDYTSLVPYDLDFDSLEYQQQYRLTESKVFCMLPWVHMHGFPDGRAYPCCLGDYWHPIGDLRKNTMREIWNQPPMRLMRSNMLQDKPCVECVKCYEQEENGFFSNRNSANKQYGKLINEIADTREDGWHAEFKIRYWDIRFSNLCNFKCRTCGPIFSSNWYQDHVKLYNKKPDVLGREMAVVEYAGRTKTDIQEQMLEHVPNLEVVYFAGGEPLLMDEHYALLEKLIENKKTDIRLVYNTNFSVLQYKDKHVFEYWKHFKDISIGASLDASGSRAELIRKGAKWEQTVENRRRMMEDVPHVDFYVSATVSAMNVLHVLDFHKEWVDLGLIKPQDFNVNICQSPTWYRVDIFPEWFKREVIVPAYAAHIEWLRPHDTLKRAIVGFESVLNIMNASDGTAHWREFSNEINKLDTLRSEDFWETFPELSVLKGL